jgi:predicted tellurium resistance membrane protein TerC
MEFSLTDPQIWASLLTLTALEIVLGIDNVIFISIVADRLPAHQRDNVRRIGIILALAVRLLLLAGVAWIVGLTKPVFHVWDHGVSYRDILLIAGGLFLLAKGTTEIHHAVEGQDEGARAAGASITYTAALGQIVVLDIVFSFDSIITAVGMTSLLVVMYAAVIISMIVMLVASGPVAAFIRRHPTVKMLALSFLILIGVALIADGLHFHIPKGYLYFAVAFSVGVEALNLAAAKRKRQRR